MEKGVVYAVSDAFHLFPTSMKSTKIRRRVIINNDNDNDNNNDNDDAEEDDDIMVDRWKHQLMRRNINGAHIDNMLGRIMGVSNEDELEKPVSSERASCENENEERSDDYSCLVA